MATDEDVWDTEALHEVILGLHNRLREEHGTPPLVVSDQMTKWARLAASDCAKQDKLVFHHRGKNDMGAGNAGQNLWAYRPADTTVSEEFALQVACQGVQEWHSEIDNWDFEKSTSKPAPGKKRAEKLPTKHFTQMMWKDSKRFGCAVGRSRVSGTWYLACNYCPEGNVSRSYRKNVLPVGGLPEEQEDEHSEDEIDDLPHTRRQGMTEVRQHFCLGGELEIFVEDEQEWCPGVIAQHGKGKTVLEFQSPSQGLLQRTISLGDTHLRAVKKKDPRKEPSTKKASAKSGGKSALSRSHGHGKSLADHVHFSVQGSDPSSLERERRPSSREGRRPSSREGRPSSREGRRPSSREGRRPSSREGRRPSVEERPSRKTALSASFDAATQARRSTAMESLESTHVVWETRDALLQHHKQLSYYSNLQSVVTDTAKHRRAVALSDEPPATSILEKREQRARYLFKQFDVDDSGTISSEELMEVFSRLGFPRKKVETLFGAIDVNGDGNVDYDEFLSWLFQGSRERRMSAASNFSATC